MGKTWNEPRNYGGKLEDKLNQMRRHLERDEAEEEIDEALASEEVTDVPDTR